MRTFDDRFTRFNRNNNSRRKTIAGLAFVEFAVLLPFFLLLFSLAWGQLVNLICKIRQEATALQLSINFQDSALKAAIDATTNPEVPQLKLSELGVTSIAELTDIDSGFLPRFNRLFNNIISNSGSFSNLVENNVAIELWYVHICTGLTSSSPPPECLLPNSAGNAYSPHVAGDSPDVSPPQPQRFFTAPGGNACFGAPGSARYNRIKAQFDAYVTSQKQIILANALNKPFGVEIIKVPGVGGVGEIDSYLPLRPIVFMAMCSAPPAIIPQEPAVTITTMFLDGGLSF